MSIKDVLPERGCRTDATAPFFLRNAPAFLPRLTGCEAPPLYEAAVRIRLYGLLFMLSYDQLDRVHQDILIRRLHKILIHPGTKSKLFLRLRGIG